MIALFMLIVKNAGKTNHQTCGTCKKTGHGAISAQKRYFFYTGEFRVKKTPFATSCNSLNAMH